MSERKVLNKYYPPDFDPAKVPKLRMQRERQYTVRTMAPFNMRCTTCGDYIYQGKKFNAKTENVQDETYLGLRIYRFYIKCPKCISEISFKTDPENEDYALEHGATRLFEAAKMLRKATEQEKQDREEEEANNPMKVLENRTKDSKLEMEIIENLEELKELNSRKVDIDYSEILRRKAEASEELMRKQEEEDEALVAKLFGKQEGGMIKRLEDDVDEDEGATSYSSSFKVPSAIKRPSDILTSDDVPILKKSKPQEPTRSKFSSKSALAGLVKVKHSTPKSAASATQSSAINSESSQVDTSTTESSSKSSSSSEVYGGNGLMTCVNAEVASTSQGLPSSSSEAKEVPKGSDHQGDGQQTDGQQDSDQHGDDIPEPDNDLISRSIQEGLSKRLTAGFAQGARPKAKSVGLSLLGGYDVSDDSNDSDDSSD